MKTTLWMNVLLATLGSGLVTLHVFAAQDDPPPTAAALARAAIAPVFAAQPVLPEPVDPADTPTAYEFELSRVMLQPQATLPSQIMSVESFGDGSVLPSLLGTNEALTTIALTGQRERLESQNWFLSVDTSAGSILATRKPHMVVPARQDPAALASDALTRLAQFGVPSEEFLDVLPRELKRQVQSKRGNEPAEVIRYKTFVLRGINGIPVQGHRAVITHHLDGSLQKALVKWPPLARSGHLLSTDLSMDQLMVRTARVLRSKGIPSGPVALRWKYVPTQLDSGEVTLELVAAARVAGGQQGMFNEEPQEIDVHVDAK